MHCSSRLLFVLAASVCAGPSVASEPAANESGAVSTPVDLERRQREAIAAMPAVTVTYGDAGVVQAIVGDTGLFLSDPGATPRVDHGAAVLSLLAPVLRAAGTEHLAVERVFADRVGRRLVHYSQEIRGVPVKGGISLAIDRATGQIVSLGSQFLPDHGLPERATLDGAEARRLLEVALVESLFADRGSVEATGTPVLSYVTSQEDGRPTLVWLVAASYTSAGAGREQREFWVDAQSGRVEGSEPIGAAFANLSYSAGNQMPLATAFPSGLSLSVDAAALAALQNVAETEVGWNAFTNLPSSIGSVNVVVHYGNNVPNGYYYQGAGHHWLIFGDGGAPVYQKPFGSSRDAVAHEWGHGQFRRETLGTVSGSKEQSSIDEAFADLSAVVVGNRFAAGLGAFEIGEDLRSNGIPLRSWSAPKLADPMAVDWYPLRFLGMDPHLNVTVMGHAFYLLSQGGTHYRAGLGVPTINVPALGFGVAGNIFYWSMRDPQMRGATSFIKVRQVTEAVAESLYPGGTTRQAVSAAWDAVGVKYGCLVPPAVPTLEIIDFMCGGHHILNWAPVPSATTYFAEKVPQGWPWSLAKPATDGPFNSCNQDVPSPFRIRLQSCNGCGCSPFGPAALLQFYQQCL
jgi:Zn-dependent metalloprotease